MASLVTIDDLRRRDPEPDVLNATWYLIATAAFTAAGAGSNVVHLYREVTSELSLEKKKLVQRRIKEAILKSTVFCGVPRTAQASFPLFEALPAEEIDHYGPRTESFNSPDENSAREKRGEKFFNLLWTKEAADKIRSSLQKYQPDLYLVNQKLIYDFWMAEDRILSPIETELVAVAALVPMNCPQQLLWHIKGVRRHGGTLEQVQLAHEMGLKISQAAGLPTALTPDLNAVWIETY